MTINEATIPDIGPSFSDDWGDSIAVVNSQPGLEGREFRLVIGHVTAGKSTYVSQQGGFDVDSARIWSTEPFLKRLRHAKDWGRANRIWSLQVAGALGAYLEDPNSVPDFYDHGPHICNYLMLWPLVTEIIILPVLTDAEIRRRLIKRGDFSDGIWQTAMYNRDDVLKFTEAPPPLLRARLTML
jgi:hypothetical protein